MWTLKLTTSLFRWHMISVGWGCSVRVRNQSTNVTMFFKSEGTYNFVTLKKTKTKTLEIATRANSKCWFSKCENSGFPYYVNFDPDTQSYWVTSFHSYIRTVLYLKILGCIQLQAAFCDLLLFLSSFVSVSVCRFVCVWLGRVWNQSYLPAF